MRRTLVIDSGNASPDLLPTSRSAVTEEGERGISSRRSADARASGSPGAKKLSAHEARGAACTRAMSSESER